MPIEVIEELDDVCHPDSDLGLDTLGDIHVHVELDVGLSKVQDKFHLACTTFVEY